MLIVCQHEFKHEVTKKRRRQKKRPETSETSRNSQPSLEILFLVQLLKVYRKVAYLVTLISSCLSLGALYFSLRMVINYWSNKTMLFSLLRFLFQQMKLQSVGCSFPTQISTALFCFMYKYLLSKSRIFILCTLEKRRKFSLVTFFRSADSASTFRKNAQPMSNAKADIKK